LEQEEKAFFVPLSFLGFVTSLGQGTDDERTKITEFLNELRKSKEFQEKLFELSSFVSKKYQTNFLMIPRFVEVSDKPEHKDIINKFITYLGNSEEDVAELDDTKAKDLFNRVGKHKNDRL